MSEEVFDLDLTTIKDAYVSYIGRDSGHFISFERAEWLSARPGTSFTYDLEESP